jgi:hypothetical protein
MTGLADSLDGDDTISPATQAKVAESLTGLLAEEVTKERYDSVKEVVGKLDLYAKRYPASKGVLEVLRSEVTDLATPKGVAGPTDL